MLSSLYITKSKIRRDLLALFFTNPFKEYYLRQLERLLGYSAGSIRRELLKFCEDGLFTTKKQGNLLYYSVNTNYPLYNEIKTIIFKTVGVEGLLKETLSKISEIKTAFIFGSFASKTENIESDIDLMIIGDPDISLLNEKIAGLESKLKREINFVVYSVKEYNSKKRMKSGFILDIIENPKIILIGDNDDL